MGVLGKWKNPVLGALIGFAAALCVILLPLEVNVWMALVLSMAAARDLRSKEEPALLKKEVAKPEVTTA